MSALILFIGNPHNLFPITANGRAAVDAKGSERVAGIISPPQIAIRRAEMKDCLAIYEWRNAEETRRYFFDAEPISFEDHRQWYCRILERNDRILLIGEMNNEPVGVLRYDVSGEDALISVYLVPGINGKGIGTELLRRGTQWIRKHCPSIRILNAEIFRENVASIRAFESAGFEEHFLRYREVL